MRVILLVPCLFALKLAEAGYYKIRPPPPPPIPPASIHYGPHPPPSHHTSSSSYLFPHRAPIPPPAAHHSHHYIPHVPPYHLHTPRIPHIHKTSSREFHRLPPYHPPPKLNAYHQWKTFNTFRAPVIKETFNPPPTVSYHTPSYIKDDDKGPIHTIPAPNLGPADKPNLFQNEYNVVYQKKQDPEADLVAVLKHGIHHVNVPHSPGGYQVTEDPSLHSGHSDNPSYFAPDPDPSVPTLKVPTTTDPHSLPSNGQVPLDLYLQQQAEKVETAAAAAAQQSSSSDTLTAQDLFNLLNYQPGSTVNLLPQTQLQHIVQPNLQLFNQGLLLPQYQADIALQQQQPQFQPQFQTFNYDERTQQGAYGSNSFPSSSMSIQINNGHGHSDLYDTASFLDNSVAGSEREEIYHNEIIQQSNNERKIGEKRDEKSISKNQIVNSGNKYTTKIAQHKISAQQVTQAPIENSVSPHPFKENIKNEVTPVKTEGNHDIGNKEKNLDVLKPDDNVQLQKSIQIYESNYSSPSTSKESQEDIKDVYEYNKGYQKGKKTGRGIVIGQVISENINPNSESEQSELPFGTRIRPKRY